MKDNTITAHTVSASNYAVGSTNFISASRQGNFRDLEVKDSGNSATILLTGDGGDISIDGTLSADTISEKTSAMGVTIDGVLLKDNDISANDISSNNLYVDTINERTSASGVTIDGVLLKDNNVTCTDLTASGTTSVATQSAGDNTTKIASTAFVKTAIDNLIDGAPGTMDTLKELSTALDNNNSYATTITLQLAQKAPKADPTFTGTPLAPTATTGTNTTQLATTAFVQTAVSGKQDTLTSVGSGIIITATERTDYTDVSNNAVRLTGVQTVAGAKTFSSAVTVGNYTLPTTAGTQGQVLKYPSSGSTLTWGSSGSGGSSIDATTDVSLNDLGVYGDLSCNAVKLGGHIIPDTNATYDLGNASYKIRHLFLSDNSLWVGDDHKIDIVGGKMKFKKRNKTTVPASITAASGNSGAALAHSGLGSLAEMKLHHWEAYAHTLSGLETSNIKDIFVSGTAGDWEVDDALDDDLTIARTTGLQAALDAKQATITDASLTIARTTGLQAALDAKQATIGNGDLTIARTTGLQTALDAKAALAGPTLTGTPVAPTATAGTNTTQLATTAFVKTAVDNLVSSAPGALDTLNELAAAIGDDANYAATITTALATKQATITDASLTIARTNGLQAALDAKQASITTLARLNANLIHDGSISNTEFGYLNGVTSAIQTQIDTKQATLTAGTNITITGSTISASGGGGNADTVTNGVYTTGAQTVGGAKTFSSAVTVGNYTLPTTAGTSGQVLKYPGAGSTLEWGSGGGSSTKKGQVLETLAGVCDGRTVVVESGTYTLPNVIAYQDWSSGWEDLTGTSINYTPPTGSNQVIFEFHGTSVPDPSDGNTAYRHFFKFRMLIDGTHVENNDDEWGVAVSSGVTINVDYRGIIDIGGTTDLANGNLSSWDSPKTIKLQLWCSSPSYQTRFHAFWYDAADNGTRSDGNYSLAVPNIKIQSIGEGTVGAVSNAVTTSGDQTIAGTKTFSNAIISASYTTTQRDALTGVAGMVIFNTTVNKHQGYNGSSWNDFY